METAYEESNSTAKSIGLKYLDNSQGINVISLMVKYYVPLTHINKVIKLLKFQSEINLQLMGDAIERILLRISFGCALAPRKQI